MSKKTDQFTKVPVSSIPSNTFDLSHVHKTTIDAGFIYPVSIVESLPGDYFKYNNTALLRLQPMVAPVMDGMDITTVTGFVPMRLIWENSEAFFANPVPNEDTPVPPHFENFRVQVKSLGDYLGLPTVKVYDESTGGTRVQYGQQPTLAKGQSLQDEPYGNGIDWASALPFAAYQKFFNDWFRDENLYNNGEPVDFMLTDGVNDFSKFNILRKRAWRHDYFTSALPFAQKGDPVEIPLGAFAPIVRNAESGNTPLYGNQDGTVLSSGDITTNVQGNNIFYANPLQRDGKPLVMHPNNSLLADLSSASAVTINTLRWAEKLQVFLEKNARGGTRYTELILQHFGARSSDARLQRAEFLGFSVNPVTISEVLQTTQQADSDTSLGDMGGHGISYGGSKTVNYYAEEHGFFITMVSIRPKTTYFQGLSKMWTRKDPLAYAWPVFASLGEQEIKNKEIYYGNDLVKNEETFGYIPRYAEYRYESDRVSGEMRTTYAYWHMARIFPDFPELNEDFISATPTKRIFAVTLGGNTPYILNIKNNLTVRRALPKYSIPAL